MIMKIMEKLVAQMFAGANQVPFETLIAQVTDSHEKIIASHDDPRLVIYFGAGANKNGGLCVRNVRVAGEATDVPASYLQNPMFHLDDDGNLAFIATNKAGAITRRKIVTEAA